MGCGKGFGIYPICKRKALECFLFVFFFNILTISVYVCLFKNQASYCIVRLHIVLVFHFFRGEELGPGVSVTGNVILIKAFNFS